jgi:quercetin dioxygenase-like cupin family protein
VEHFRHVATLDAAPLAAAVAENAARFGDLTFRQKAPGSAHPDTETIYLRMPAEITAETIFEGLDAVSYPAWEIAPLREVAERIADATQGRLGRVMVIKLKPGGRIAPHVDEGGYALATARFHLVIATNPGAWLEAGGERVHMAAGELWWFDKHAPHRGANEGATDRVHMVIDLFLPETV